MKKKILIVCRGFYPDISPRSFRATELAKEFSARGHDVTVLTVARGDVYADLLSKYPAIRIVSLPSLRFRNLGIRGPKYWSLFKRGINRIMMQLFEYPGIELSFKVSHTLKKMGRFDLLVSIAVPHTIHWGVARAWTRGRLAGAWIADCGDPYMGEATDSFRKPFYFSFVEKWFMRKADIVTIPIESAKRAYYPEFHQKIRVIPQGYSFENKVIHSDKRSDGIPRFAYAGSFIPGVRDPRHFMNYLIEKESAFLFEVFTSHQDLIRELAKKSKGRIVIRDIVSRDTLFKEFGKMDFLVNFDNNTSVHSPSKLIDYAISGLPILNITKDFDTASVDSFLRGDYSTAIKVADLQKYNIKNVASQFLQTADEVHPSELNVIGKTERMIPEADHYKSK